MEDLNEESEADALAEIERQHEEYLRRLAEAAVVDVVGVVSAAGSGGTGSGHGDGWALVFHFDGWRRIGEAMQRGELRVEMPVPKDALSSYIARVEAHDVVHVRGRVAEHPAGGMQALAQELIATGVRDAELEARAVELQKPVVVEDPRFGTLTLDRAVHWFEATPVWDGKTVNLYLHMDEADSIAQPLAVAAELWKSQQEWNAKVRDYAVQELLALKKEAWLAEDEAPPGPDEFKARMTLESIAVRADGSFEFWHDDGDLFWGHEIMVSGSLRGGLDEADICG